MAIDEQLQSLVYFLSDHLFAAIEAGEKIRCADLKRPNAETDLTSTEILVELDALRQFITDLSDWEEEMVTKVNQARQWSSYLREHDTFFKPITDLFAGATQPLTDIQAQINDHHDRHFEGGDHPDWFITSRSINCEKSDDGQILSLNTASGYLLGGRVDLTGLIELAETYLETLEARYPQLWLPSDKVLVETDPEGEHSHHPE